MIIFGNGIEWNPVSEFSSTTYNELHRGKIRGGYLKNDSYLRMMNLENILEELEVNCN